MSRLSHVECAARAEALEEAAGHLELDWTEDAIEFREGERIARRLRKQAERWRLRAIARLPREDEA